ncbi:MAG TPA: GNAT family N-acetyltransferase [Tepidisphaeraceae bacterium]|nr:GNAT family N-acetyltransferase [Tepidisphaeraceae bacterium]
MGLELRWVGDEDRERVAETRLLCYAPAERLRAEYRERTATDPLARGGDFLLAEADGQAVGTTTSLSLDMWVRGGRVPCQGVAWVGTIKTRRRTGQNAEKGIATRLMQETLSKAREREQAVTALMPFRASFYEHFGYGVVERRHEWTVPIAVLRQGACDGVRFYDPARDFAARSAAKQRLAQAGQCDFERPDALWRRYDQVAQDGFQVVDRVVGDGPVRAWMYVQHEHVAAPAGDPALGGGKDVLKVVEVGYQDVAALTRLLHFMASLRDQYHAVRLTLPADLPLNLLLRESQIPHRPVNHPAASVRPFTRMQVRVLDHGKLLEAIHWPADLRGKVTVAVQETEGYCSTFAVEVECGRATVTPAKGSPQVAVSDNTWAQIATGELRASDAWRLKLIAAEDVAALRVLDGLAQGPVPFTMEYF